MTDEPNYLEALRSDLCHALGEAVWAFSMIERLTYRYMKALSSEPLHELMADQGFNARIKLVKRLIDRLQGQDEEKTYALHYVRRAEQLAATRNMVAHNPWQIRVDFQTDEFKSAIRKFEDDRPGLDIAEVRRFAADAQEAASGLEYALGNLRFRGP
ncbi:hypothetical protein [Caballeronia glebae]|uniref:hypothetical protein n=1 Tax=Caballeronia glebae TaxID=1777143 RepID=UPI000B350AAE|nr:hypothetical protein [Caballeronia glebae]